MDKSESELLEEWDVVTVSSVYETEKENDAQESTNSDTVNNAGDTNVSSNVDNDANAMTGTVKAVGDAAAESESNTVTQKESHGMTETVSKVEPESEGSAEVELETNVEAEPESSVEVEPERNIEAEPENNNEAELESDIEDEPETVIEAGPERSAATVEPESCASIAESENDTVAQPVSSATVEPESSVEIEHERNVMAQPENSCTTEQKDDIEIESEVTTDEKSSAVHTDYNAEAVEQNTDKNTAEDIVHVVLDSSLAGFEIEDYIQDVPELVPERIEVEQEMAAIESSSSDIDIIDENVEESITSSFISPLSLSISSSVADTSSIHSFTSQSDDSKDHKPEQKIEDIERKEDIKKRENIQKEEIKHTVHSEKSYHEDKSENVHSRRRESQRTTNSRSFFNWFALLIEFFRNMSGYDWCFVGGVAVTLYFTIIVNQTNIFAIVQKDNVVSQMKDMIDELKHDNKMLKEQMLSEMKNEKVLSSFEHQIRELRKENSKLNHMLYDVAKVLDKQKGSQEKKEAEYLAPFKKEINKLKEHINILKFDNEELQKQLVRMRYASYSQGSKDATESKDRVRKEETTEAEGDASTEEIPLESLKKWNELISLLTQELGTLSGAEGFKDEKSHSDAKNKNSKPLWKAFLNDFKGTFDDLRKINFSAMLSHYRKANQKAVSDIYKFVKDFFTVEDTSDDGSQWKNIGDFVSDLKEKWTNIKDRLYTSDLKKFFEKTFKKAAVESTHDEYHSQKGSEYPSQKTKGSGSEHTESRSTNTRLESENKHDRVQIPEDTKWMFKRAAHREELRNTDEEVNWFLKKGRHNSEDDKEL